MPVPKSRAINTPSSKCVVRSPQAPHRIEYHVPKLKGLPELIANFKKNHPECESQQLKTFWRKTEEGAFEFGCYFIGRWVRFKRSQFPPEFNIVSAKTLLEVAVHVLEQTFGKEKDLLSYEFGPSAIALCREQRDGSMRIIAWDQENDCIVVKTKEGLALSTQGSNLIEAAIWLPRMYEQALKNKSRAPEGLGAIHIGFGGMEQLSKAASPVDMDCQAVDYRYLNPHDGAAFDSVIKGTFEISFSNRKAA